MDVKDILIAAKAKIDTRHKWTKGYWARNARSRAVQFTDESACKFCAVGAVKHVVWHEKGLARTGLFDQSIDVLEAQLPSRSSVSYFNDRKSTGHIHIMALFDKAIASCDPEDCDNPTQMGPWI